MGLLWSSFPSLMGVADATHAARHRKSIIVMTFPQAIASGFRNYARFSGRAARSEYWCWVLFGVLVASAARILDEAFLPELAIDIVQVGPLYVVTTLALILPGIAVAARRLHDRDRTAWWLLLWLTILGGFVLLVWFCRRGSVGPNRFGPDPLPAPAPEAPASGAGPYPQAAAMAPRPVRTKSWPVWLTVLVVIGASVLVIAGVSVAGYVWWQLYGTGLVGSIDEGRRFAAGKDRNACVDEAVARAKRGAGFSEAVSLQLFFEYCLKAARPVPGFCDGVPSKDEILKSTQWLAEMNRKHGIRSTFHQGLFTPMQVVCEGEAHRP
jgi:uncharacterized membrane protein YhaH (DUF805 family)